MILVFFLSFIIISLSIIGYGSLLLKIAKVKTNNISLGYYGLSGIFLINLYSYLLSIFSYHTKLSNTLLLFTGLFFFLFFEKTNFKNYRILFIFSIIFFIGLLVGKPHDDFEYYHFPYTVYLNNFESILGIGHLNHGFRTPSSIFYLNSTFYLPILEYYTFSFGAGYYLIFANLILIDYLKDRLFKNNTFIIFFSIFILLFINIFFYRIGEHGTDRSAQILIFLLILELFIFINLKINFKIKLTFLIILISLIVSLKAFYLIYFIFTLLIFDHLIRIKKKKFSELIDIFFKNPIIVFAIINLILIFIIYFINTGCVVYPLSISCIENVEWSISKKEVEEMNLWYELWSKGGAAPNFRVSDPTNYIIKLNWVSNWLDIYFFNKVSDFILGLIILSGTIYFSFKNKIKNNQSIRYKFLILIIIFLLLEWFFKHPSLRYGGYCLIAILFAIPISLKLSKHKINYSKLQQKILILIIVSLLIFTGRNINRLNKEYINYNYKPVINFRYSLSDSHFRINNQIKNLEKNFQNCLDLKKTCKNNMRFYLKKYNEKNMINKND